MDLKGNWANIQDLFKKVPHTKNILYIVLIATFLSGCVPQYNLAPKYNEKNATVYIDNFSIDSVIYHQKQSEFPDDIQVSVKRTSEYFKTTDEQCSSFVVDKFKADGDWHYRASTNQIALRMHNGKCDIERIGNIYFLKCLGKNKIVTDGNESIEKTIDYYINTFSNKDMGYGLMITIRDLSRACYNKFKQHFSSITQSVHIESINTY